MSDQRTIAERNPPVCNQNISEAHPGSQGESLFSIKNHKRSYVFKVYDNYVEFTPPTGTTDTHFTHESKRGIIKSFSPRSRFRLFALLAKIKDIKSSNAIFVTLTYHYGFKGDDRAAQKDLHNFLSRLRNFDNNVQYIWRLEYQDRGAPHFHFILFPGSSYNSNDHEKYVSSLSLLWHNIADPTSNAHAKYGFKECKITNYRKACAYLSKYIAKLPRFNPDVLSAKQWGNSRDLPIVFESIHFCNEQYAMSVIEELRRWFAKNGKERYCTPEYFNVTRPQGVFISKDDFSKLLESMTYKVCVSDCIPLGFS